MSQNRMPEAVDNIRNRLFLEKGKSYRAGKILWIVRQYIKYALLAAIHGYPVGPSYPIATHCKGRFELGVKYWEYVPWHLRRKLTFSAKASGYEFRLVLDSIILKRHNYYFNPASKWKKMIRELIETDEVYKLIPKQ